MDVSALLKDGGATAWAAAGLGVLGCVCGIALLAGTLFGARSSILRGMAFITVALALVATVCGVAGTLTGRGTTEDAVHKQRPATAERLRRAGWTESRANVTLALPLTAPAALLALAGFVVASRRRQLEDPEAEGPPAGAGLFVLLLLFFGAGWVFAGRLWKQPEPGRELDDASWKVLDLADALDADEWEKCFTTPWSLGAATPAHALPAHVNNQKRCAEHFTTSDDLRRLLSAAWVDDPLLRDALNRRLNEPPPAPTPPPQPAQPAPPPVAEKPPEPAPPPDTSPSATPDPAIAMLESKVKHCFKKHPRLDLHVTVSKEGHIHLPKHSAKCLKLAVAKIKLPPGNARELEVQLK